MTYDDITEATRQTLADFAESRRVLDLEEINGTLGFTHDCTSIIWRRDFTPELIALIEETEEANGREAWGAIDLAEVSDNKDWYAL